MASAGELKYTRQIKKLINEQIEKPSDEFVRLFAAKVFDGILTPARRDYFSDLTRRSFKQLINERINERLKAVMSGNADLSESEDDDDKTDSRENLIETTAEELEGFYIIKSLLRDIVDVNRITHRDTQSYMGILLDDNNRKPLARLHFNRSQKYLGIFDESRQEKRVPIENLDEIYKYGDELRRVFAFYNSENDSGGDQEA